MAEGESGVVGCVGAAAGESGRCADAPPSIMSRGRLLSLTLTGRGGEAAVGQLSTRLHSNKLV